MCQSSAKWVGIPEQIEDDPGSKKPKRTFHPNVTRSRVQNAVGPPGSLGEGLLPEVVMGVLHQLDECDERGRGGLATRLSSGLRNVPESSETLPKLYGLRSIKTGRQCELDFRCPPCFDRRQGTLKVRE